MYLHSSMGDLLQKLEIPWQNGEVVTYEAVDSSKNELSHMYVAVIYLLVQKLVLLETSALVKLQVNLSCSSFFTELADEFIQNLDNLQSFWKSSSSKQQLCNFAIT